MGNGTSHNKSKGRNNQLPAGPATQVSTAPQEYPEADPPAIVAARAALPLKTPSSIPHVSSIPAEVISFKEQPVHHAADAVTARLLNDHKFFCRVVEKVFNVVDANHDGVLQCSEIAAFVHKIAQNQARKPLQEQIQMMYTADLDVDHNGVVTKTEFLHFMQQILKQ